jgi:hypothetical protein
MGVFCRYDISRDLEPQFKVIQEAVRAQQLSYGNRMLRPRKHKDKWPLYLRVLDARDCRATYPKIADVLALPHDQETRGAVYAVRDLVRAAKELRDAWPFASEEENASPLDLDEFLASLP